MTEAHMDCTTCSNHQRLIVFNDDGVADIEHICTYFERSLTKEEMKEPCDEYEERWDE